MTTHERLQRLFAKLITRQHSAIHFGRLRMALLEQQAATELHERIDVELLEMFAMLEMPVPDRFAVEKVTAIARERRLETRARSLLLPQQRASRGRYLALERRHVEFLDQRRIDTIPVANERHPLGAA